MTIHREGNKIIGITLLIVIILGLLVWQTVPWEPLRYFLLAGFLVHLLWTISFFRVPKRVVNRQANAILSAADGKVVTIEEIFESEHLKENCIMVSVFMSPFNVHVNWYPIDGTVSYTKYHAGKYLAAYNPKSSLLNERNTVVVTNDDGKSVLFRQIAGVMARRIISYAKKGDKAVAGAQYGIIRFGSRVDFYLPADTRINVKIGEKVKAQQTILGYFQ